MDAKTSESLRQAVCAARAILVASASDAASAHAVGIRLVALRCIEARGLATAPGSREAHADLAVSCARAAEVAPRLLDADVASELGRAVSREAMQRAASALAASPDASFQAPEALGWAHQYWNAPEKDRVFQALRAERGRKIGAADVVPATQLYTDRHLVDFLLENSLVAPWIAARPSSRLAARCRFLVRGALPAHPPERAARSIRLLDPACGTGHFLVRAFDLFFAMYEDEGAVDPQTIARSILTHNLRGMDLDAEAVAIAEAVLSMRAVELAPGLVVPRADLAACDVALADASGVLRDHLAEHPEDHSARSDLELTYAALGRADVLGALLPLEEGAGPESARARRRALERFASSHPRARHAVEILRTRYDVVAMNPPYVGFRKLAPDLRALVARDPLAELDLFVAFLSRGFALLAPGGALAAITPSSWTTSSRTEPLRRAMIDAGGPSVVAALGQRVFETAPLLFVSLIVVRRADPSLPAGAPHFVSLRPPGRSGAEGLARAVREGGRRWPYEVAFEETSLPFFPTAPLELLRASKSWPKLGDFFTLVDGVWSGENDRDVREAWELPPGDAASVPTAGGQGYARWDAAPFRRVRAEVAAAWSGFAARAAESPAIEYARVAGGKLSARLARPGTAAIAGVVTLIPHPTTERARIFEALAMFNARLGTVWLATLTSGLNFNPGYAARIPLGPAPPAPSFEAEIRAVVALKREDSAEDLACDDFDPAIFERDREGGLLERADRFAARGLERAAAILEAEAVIERRLQQHLGLSDEAWAEIGREVGEAAGSLPRSIGEAAPADPASADPAAGEEEKDDATPTCPAESDLEALSRAHGIHPRSLLQPIGLDAGLANEVARAANERRRAYAADLLTLLVLRGFGDRSASKPARAPVVWILSDGAADRSLIAALRGRLAEIFGDVAACERDIATLLARPLGRFLHDDLVPRHIARFRRRPVLWQLASRPERARRPPAFACLVHAHDAGAPLLALIAAHATERRDVLRAARRDEARSSAQRETEIAEIDRFIQTLAQVADRGFACAELAATSDDTARHRDAAAYTPRPEDGVRVNIAPLQRAGLLAFPVLAPPDVERAIADRARWRKARSHAPTPI